MKIAIIGGGAAGFFLAVNLKTFAPQVEVTVLERQADVLKKVLVSGGGATGYRQRTLQPDQYF